MRALVPLLIAISTLGPTPAAASQYASPYHELQAMDGQLATIGYRLATANAPLCERLDGATGLQLHDIAQYRDRDAITGVFAFESPVEVEAVVPGSPGDTAGILPDDALVALHHETQTQRIKAMTEGLTDDPYMRIQRIADAFAAATSAGHPVTLDLLRHGRPLSITLTPAPACATRFQLLIEKGYDAGADGRMVSVNLPLMQYALGAPDGEGQLAAVVAHEFAHNILRHRERLNAVDIKRGIGRMFGKNPRRIRQTEEEADRLSVWLLANAGYDPASAIRFWERFGREHGEGLISDGTHARWKERAKAIDEEIARLPTAATRDGAKVPPILTQPLPSLK
ncbi:MAG: peptidase M48 family protein [Sphingorhabdus sp.]|nr:peptidase M48 family protein [Sphingorhabdus sp.]|tara:strand:+ start:35 stop:1054 length:1020 start_codon:yes stop_codon:yes gene_type:complete